jgi:hypothetical protein
MTNCYANYGVLIPPTFTSLRPEIYIVRGFG